MLTIRKSLAAMLLLAMVVAVQAAPVPGVKAGGEDGDKWLLDDAEFVMVFNFKQLFDSKLLKSKYTDVLKDAIKNNEKAKEAVDMLGLDVTKDVDSIIISGAGSDKETAKARFVLKGNFDVEKLSAAMKKANNVTATKVGKVQLFEIEAQGQTLYGAFNGKTTFVITESKDATVSLAKDGPSRAAKINKSLKSALGRFTGKESMAIAVVLTEEVKKQAAAIPQPAVAAALKSLETVTLSTTVTDSVTINLVGSTTDAKAAAQMAKQLTGLKAIAELAIGGMDNVPEFAKKAIEAIKIDNTRDTITITMPISKDIIEKAEKAAKRE